MSMRGMLHGGAGGLVVGTREREGRIEISAWVSRRGRWSQKERSSSYKETSASASPG